MSLNLSDVSLWSALAGGLLIGLAVALLLLGCGQVAGISGLLGRLLRWPGTGNAWRWSFLLGLVLAPVLARLAATLPEASVQAGWPLLMVSGALVGVGTGMANGCTSGHGVCGLARGSRRSLAATLIFMATGMVTVFLSRHLGS